MDDWRGTDILSQYLLAAELFLDYLNYSEYFWIHCHNIYLMRNYFWIILNTFGITKNKRPRLFFSIAVRDGV